MGRDIAVRRLDLGHFLRPAAEADGSRPRVESALAYLVRHDRGLILFDTGIGRADAATEARHRPRRRPLPDALAAAGVSLGDIALVVNCHLHFDHCGGNPLLAGRPVLVQATELDAARRGDYTVDGLVDFPGAAYERLNGDAEIWPDVWVIATPGHTRGHQSLVVRRSDGDVVLAGQACDRASDFAAEHLAREAGSAGARGPLPTYRPWFDRLAEFDPQRVLFAHDCSVWEPATYAGR
ncbi:N-acyl homoserine lactonase family protein [Streptomyces sp. N35]|uniref:N-acyl homoserine lactonase family protein n=1 Tax=Streptomyces sp. N35 TaxID=2795730 RepID=UPI0018F6532A|nr:N-acyl homoserine lactonase family protein [Streptomyces sp. N35]